ncbi:carboxylesterase NlhH [Acrasis kona]|uniref:Carboxylesterase NlhH n=1 Tax=Acrasis kona TaxID=1008807 RepID=A0AAW2YUJ6_9EUKA
MQRLDDSVRNLFQAMKENSDSPPIESLSLEDLREGYRVSRKKLAPEPQNVAEVQDIQIPTHNGSVTVRLYRGINTTTQTKLPCLIYFHGGGWVVGSIDTHDYICRIIANDANCIVASVDYNLSPESKFPSAVEESFQVLKYISLEGSRRGIDTTRIALGGDSAGGNLAAVTAILARDRSIAVKYQVLVYPVCDLHLRSSSYDTLGEEYLLTRDSMQYYVDKYLDNLDQRDDWRASPILAQDMSNLPSALVITAGLDPLCEEGIKYANKLKEANVNVKIKEFSGQIHGFLAMGGAIPEALEAISDIVKGIKQHV